MNLQEKNITEYELEITSNCNAECPLCIRTKLKMPLSGNSEFNLQDLKSIFSKREQIENKDFKLCGTAGDPIINPEMLEMCEYLTDNGAAKIMISTNGGLNPPSWWERLAKLPNIRVDFAVDGAEKTNHLYRVNVKWKTLIRNMRAYTSAGGNGTWTFIPFGHNEGEYEIARDIAKELGLVFRRRTSGRNELELVKDRLLYSKSVVKKQKITKRIVLQKSKNIPHVDVTDVNKVRDAIKNKDHKEVTKASATICCKHKESPELFISSDMKLWPCCYLSDEHLKSTRQESKNSKFNRDNGDDWNSLKKYSIEEILKNPSFTDLTSAWNPEHEYFVERCVQTCVFKGAYHNKIDRIEKK